MPASKLVLEDMITHLKRGKPAQERAEDDEKVRRVVEDILADIEARGDIAVRELSQKFDSYSPATFRLSASEIEAAMNKVAARDMADIKFAQEQVRKFAQAQRASMTDIEVETLPGVVLGHRNIRFQTLHPASTPHQLLLVHGRVNHLGDEPILETFLVAKPWHGQSYVTKYLG